MVLLGEGHPGARLILGWGHPSNCYRLGRTRGSAPIIGMDGYALSPTGNSFDNSIFVSKSVLRNFSDEEFMVS